MAEYIKKVSLNQGRKVFNDTLTDFQTQINQMVVDGDSSVEAAQARVDNEGNTYDTLKERLDTEKEEFNQLSQTVSDNYDEVTSHLAETNTNIEEISINISSDGAIGDGVTDNTQIIKDIISNMSEGETLYFPGGYEYLVTDTITVDKNINVIMNSPIILDSENNIPCLIVEHATNRIEEVELKLWVKRKDYQLWDSIEDIGVKLVNCHSTNNINIVGAEKFNVGVKCVGDGQGFAHNNSIILRNVIQNKIHLYLDAINSGYVNENIFIGGRFTNFGDTSPDNDDKTTRRAIVIDSSDESYIRNNNNIFIKPTLQNEGGTGIEIKHGNQNKFIGVRSEGVEEIVLFENNSQNNTVEVLYSSTESESYLNNSDNSTNIVKIDRYSDLRESNRLLVDRNNLEELFNDTDNTVDKCILYRIAGNGIIEESPDSSEVYMDEEFLSLTTNGVGVNLTTDNVKKFTLSIGYAEDSDHWVMVRPFNSEGNELDDSSIRVKGSGRSGEKFSNYGYGMFRTSTATKNVSFEVTDEVKKIWVGVGRSSAGTAKIQGFQIFTSQYGYVKVN